MRSVTQHRQFQRDYKLQKRRGKNIKKLEIVVQNLAERGDLPQKYHPHKLTGEYKDLWECHIEPDWLLIYDITNTELTLVRTGSHPDLFK